MPNLFRRLFGQASSAQTRGDQPPTKLNWTHHELLEGTLQFDEWRFHVCLPDVMNDKPSSAHDFIVLKVPSMIEMIAELAAQQPKYIFELGVYKGGSVALYNELFKPDKLVAIDLGANPLPQLEAYIKSRAAEKQVSFHLGVDQSDHARLAQICQREFGKQPLDLVIDDASHFLFETRESFRELFPRLRPGGVYVIEDWGWAHWGGDLWQLQQGGDQFRGKEPLTNLLLELVVLAASRPNLVSQVCVESATIYIKRGAEEVKPGFDPALFCLNRGNPLPRF